MEKERWVILGSDLYYLTIAWAFDAGSSGSSNPLLSVSNKASTRNCVANNLQSTWNYCTTLTQLAFSTATQFCLDLHNPTWHQNLAWIFTTGNVKSGELSRGATFFFFFWPFLLMRLAALIFIDLLLRNKQLFLRLFTPFVLAVGSVRCERCYMCEPL